MPSLGIKADGCFSGTLEKYQCTIVSPPLTQATWSAMVNASDATCVKFVAGAGSIQGGSTTRLGSGWIWRPFARYDTSVMAGKRACFYLLMQAFASDHPESFRIVSIDPCSDGTWGTNAMWGALRSGQCIAIGHHHSDPSTPSNMIVRIPECFINHYGYTYIGVIELTNDWGDSVPCNGTPPWYYSFNRTNFYVGDYMGSYMWACEYYPGTPPDPWWCIRCTTCSPPTVVGGPCWKYVTMLPYRIFDKGTMLNMERLAMGQYDLPYRVYDSGVRANLEAIADGIKLKRKRGDVVLPHRSSACHGNIQSNLEHLLNSFPPFQGR